MKFRNILRTTLAMISAAAVLFCLAGCQKEQKSPEISQKEQKSTETSQKEQKSTETVQSEQTNTETAQKEPKETETAQKEQAEKPHIYDITSVSGFRTADVDGNPVTADVLREHKLTLINVMSTSCGPCMAELPTLMKLSDQYQDLGFIGLNLDMDLEGNPDPDSVDTMKQMLEKNGGSMKIIFPDDVLIMQVLTKMDAMPYTFFVDQEGNVVGGDYLGAMEENQWKQVIEKELGK